jgi:pyridoxal 5'-phosphate synthase pdxT subunit
MGKESCSRESGCFRVSRKPTWGTCAGLILLAESANRTKQGGQELVGGLDVRVNRNYFGRQIESFQADLDIPFLHEHDGARGDAPEVPYPGVFIRSPIVEEVLPAIQEDEAKRDAIVVAPSRPTGLGADPKLRDAPVEILARLPGRAAMLKDGRTRENLDEKVSDIIAVRQANVFGTCFHPELTGDPRIHIWWLKQVVGAVKAVEKNGH